MEIGGHRGCVEPSSGLEFSASSHFWPEKLKLHNTDNSVSASTANELRHDRNPVNAEKLKAAPRRAVQRDVKVFAVATAAVIEGATYIFGLSASKIEVQNSEDIKAKGKELVQPKMEMLREQLTPLKNWVCRRQAEGMALGKRENYQRETYRKGAFQDYGS
ncbi:unnamed protein product [Camellia sinensis]